MGPTYKIHYVDKAPPLRGWYFTLHDSAGNQHGEESSLFADDGATIDEAGPYYGKPRGEALAIQCAKEDLENAIKRKEVK